jgi:murein L,D-transpeptidase YcbB/YkuD
VTHISISENRFTELYTIKANEMKTNNRALSNDKKDQTKTILIIGVIILLLQFTFHMTVWSKPLPLFSSSTLDTINDELQKQLHSDAVLQKLNFPKTVNRFYALNAGRPNWLRSEENVQPTVSAMLLLDCVRQYGLQRKDYHPSILTYALMHDVLSSSASYSAKQKIEFELMLTDAMVSMINHLHYGAYNPNLKRATIDSGLEKGLRAEDVLQNAKNEHELMEVILSVQPKMEEYKQLQGYMKLITGQYICDSYDTPEDEVKKIAINMERLRWSNIDDAVYLHINIPSFELNYFQADHTYQFKVVVGKPTTPTPIVSSMVYLIESAPDWNVPAKIFIKELLPKALKNYNFFENSHMAVYDTSGNIIPINAVSLAQIKVNPKLYHLRQSSGCDNALGKVVFRFANTDGIYLHDTPEQLYFKREVRALSHGCIRVENAGKLAALVLSQDHQSKKIDILNTAMANYTKKQFILSTPVPIILTYLTYTVKDGLLVRHPDIYQLDESLIQQVYGPAEQLSKN